MPYKFFGNFYCKKENKRLPKAPKHFQGKFELMQKNSSNINAFLLQIRISIVEKILLEVFFKKLLATGTVICSKTISKWVTWHRLAGVCRLGSDPQAASS